MKLEALLPYLQGKKPVVLAAEEASDLETALWEPERADNPV